MSSTNLTMRIAKTNVNHLDSMRSAPLIAIKRLNVKQKSKLPSAPIVRGTTATKDITASPGFTFTASEVSNHYLKLFVTIALGGGINGQMPTAADLCVNRNKGDSWSCILHNDASTTQTITLTVNTGVTIAGVATVATDTASELVFTVIENATGLAAVTVMVIE
jgi:hypothetical protein